MRTDNEIKADALGLAPDEMAAELQGCNSLSTVIERVTLHRRANLTQETLLALRALAKESRFNHDPRNDPAFANAPWNRK